MKTTSDKITPELQLVDRIFWLTNLRWVAVAGVLMTIGIATVFFHIPLMIRPLLAVTSFLALHNGFFAVTTAFFKSQGRHRIIQMTANLQIFLDLTCLALLIHFASGVENPFYFYFIFHIIIAGILLSRRETFLLATYTVVIFLLIIFLEYRGLLLHHCLPTVFSSSLHDNFIYLLVVAFIFSTTLYIAAYLTTSISSRLRKREHELKMANDMLAEKDRVQSEYVLRVTHDIKEDLAAIHTCIEPIQKKLTGPLNQEQEDLLERARGRSKELIVYVDSLLEMTKLKLTQKLEMHFFSLEGLVKQVSTPIAVAARDRDITFELRKNNELPSMYGVRVYIEEVFLNVLKNSIKYTPKKGRITWEISADKDQLKTTISDNGIGISKEELPRVFNEFYRAKNARLIVRKGTGLGLSLTQKIVEMHHGRVWIESELGQGTSVHMELPLTTSPDSSLAATNQVQVSK